MSTENMKHIVDRVLDLDSREIICQTADGEIIRRDIDKMTLEEAYEMMGLNAEKTEQHDKTTGEFLSNQVKSKDGKSL